MPRGKRIILDTNLRDTFRFLLSFSNPEKLCMLYSADDIEDSYDDDGDVGGGDDDEKI